MNVKPSALKHTPADLAIIGAGAAGLYAAAVAADCSLKCVVIERKARPAAKMLMTANGRCNFTKDISVERMLSDIGEPVASFVDEALRMCPPQRIVRALRAAGVKTRRMDDGRMFPDSGKAADVVHAFGDLLRDREIPLLLNCAVTGIQPMKNGFLVAMPNFTLWARNVLVATGGVSFPKTGSVGDGQKFARSLGLALEPYRAALIGYSCRTPHVARYENARARLVAGGKTLCEYAGEVEFENRGVTGAAVYNCSRIAARRNFEGYDLEVSTPEGEFRFPRPQTRPLKESIVTVGGVSRDEVDPHTMMSKKIPGLYFAGEVLDIDGPTGGYNLTLAFATARQAVMDVSRRCAEEGGLR